MNPEVEPSVAESASRRRSFLFSGVGAAAALAGAGVAWWKWSPGKTAEGAAASIWPLTFDTPAGPSLAMQSLRGRPLVLNFWATWCPPCVEEMPLLDAFYRTNSANGWQVVGLAIDQPSAVRSFLQRTPVSFPIALAGVGGTEMAKALGNLSGGLPFTVVLAASGEIVQRRIGRVTATDLAQWAQIR